MLYKELVIITTASFLIAKLDKRQRLRISFVGPLVWNSQLKKKCIDLAIEQAGTNNRDPLGDSALVHSVKVLSYTS